MKNRIKHLFLTAILLFSFAISANAATVYNNVTVALAGIREDGIVSGQLTGTFGTKWIEVDVDSSLGKPLLAVMLTAVSTGKTVTIYASQNTSNVNVFNIHWLTLEQ